MLEPSLARAGRTLAMFGAIFLGTAAACPADTTTLDGTVAPLVRIDVVTGNVNVKTWNRATVQIEADSNAVQIDRQHFAVPISTVPILAGRVQGPDGVVRLPEETFAVATLGPQDRDVVRITGRDTGPITVVIPNSTALLVVQATNSSVAIHQFTGGTFVARVQRGRVRLDRDGGSGFVQLMRGPVLVNDSNFDRFRSRTALGATVFERCRVRQIQATSVSGSIIYDRGTFDPGLARFQSDSGSIAIGVDGPAQLGGRGDRVYTSFLQRVEFQNRSAASATAIVGGGGPEVTAASTTGSVYLYDGSLRDRPNLESRWTPVSDIIRAVPTRPLGTVSRPFPTFRRPERPGNAPPRQPYGRRFPYERRPTFADRRFR